MCCADSTMLFNRTIGLLASCKVDCAKAWVTPNIDTHLSNHVSLLRCEMYNQNAQTNTQETKKEKRKSTEHENENNIFRTKLLLISSVSYAYEAIQQSVCLCRLKGKHFGIYLFLDPKNLLRPFPERLFERSSLFLKTLFFKQLLKV